MIHYKIIYTLSELFQLELSLKLRFCKFVMGIYPFSVYTNNCNEFADKYGANFDLYTDRILNEWNNSIIR